MREILSYETTKYREFTLTLQEYNARKVSEDELYLGGKLYDVKSATLKDGEVIVFAMQDDEEDNIVSRIKNLLSGDGDEDIPETIVNLLTVDYIIPNTLTFHFSTEIAATFFYSFVDTVFSRSEDTLIPPPRLA